MMMMLLMVALHHQLSTKKVLHQISPGWYCEREIRKVVDRYLRHSHHRAKFHHQRLRMLLLLELLHQLHHRLIHYFFSTVRCRYRRRWYETRVMMPPTSSSPDCYFFPR
jgi:hypothetical protein